MQPEKRENLGKHVKNERYHLNQRCQESHMELTSQMKNLYGEIQASESLKNLQDEKSENDFWVSYKTALRW